MFELLDYQFSHKKFYILKGYTSTCAKWANELELLRIEFFFKKKLLNWFPIHYRGYFCINFE